LDLNVVGRPIGDLYPERDLEQLLPADDDHPAARARTKNLCCSGRARRQHCPLCSPLCSKLCRPGKNRCHPLIEPLANDSESPDDEAHRGGKDKQREDGSQDKGSVHQKMVPHFNHRLTNIRDERQVRQLISHYPRTELR
jgi:hypothetical protein